MSVWAEDKVLPLFNIGHVLSTTHLPIKKNSPFGVVTYENHLQHIQIIVINFEICAH